MERFLDRNGWDLSAYESSDLHAIKLYRFHTRSYVSDAAPEAVWKAYTTVDLSEAWVTRCTRPGVTWNPGDSRLYLPQDAAPPFSVGQVFVLELRILGFLRIPASFRITRIDGTERLIEFVYLERNLSNGVQRIRFYQLEGPDGSRSTFIEHQTWYRSGRPFRDSALYSPFHSLIIDAFHESVFRRAGLRVKPARGNPYRTVPGTVRLIPL